MIKTRLTLLVTCICIQLSFAQKAIPTFHTATTFKEYEEIFKEISKNPDGYQGHKWIARWVEETASRIDSNGILPDLSILHKETERFNANKKNSNFKFSNTWIPVGPNDAPEPFDPTLIKGTGRINTITFHPTDPNIMWIGGGQGGIWKSVDAGQSWIPIGDDLPVLRISSIAVNPDNPDEIYVALGDYAYIAIALDLDNRNRNTHYGMGIYKTLDGGVTWQPTSFVRQQEERDYSLTRKIVIHPDDTDRILAVGLHGAWSSQDAGNSWTQINNLEYWDLESSPQDPNTLYASTGFLNNLNLGEARVLKSVDFGLTWTELSTGVPRVNNVQRLKIALSHSDSNYVYVVACNLDGGYYGMYASEDAGQSWELRSTAPNILHWGDGTSAGGQGTYDLAMVVDPQNPQRIMVGGINPWVSEDGGRTWGGAGYYIGLFGKSIHADHHYYAYNDLDDYIYACHDGGVSRTREIIQGSWDASATDPDYEWPIEWEHLNNGLANFAFYRLGVQVNNVNNIYTGAQDMGTFYQNEGTWNYLGLGDGMECYVHPNDPNILYGSTQFGRLIKSTNAGLNFLTIRPWRTEFAPWTMPFKLNENNPDILYVPVQNLWISTNGGITFTKTTDIPNDYPTSAFAVAKSDTTHMYIAKRIYHSDDQPTQVFRTVDGGNSWIDITAGLPEFLFAKYMDVDNDDPLHVWVTFGGFEEGAKVYETFDGGDSWINISSNLPNLPANCIVHQNGTDSDAIYVGMDRGVYYKDNTTDQWQLYSEGLPNVIITELEIHEESEQLLISTFGRGVWRNNLLAENPTSTAQIQVSPLYLSVTPNPNDGNFSLHIQSAESRYTTLKIVDVMGRIQHKQSLSIHPDTNVHAVNARLKPGLYYAAIQIEQQIRSIPFVVQ